MDEQKLSVSEYFKYVITLPINMQSIVVDNTVLVVSNFSAFNRQGFHLDLTVQRIQLGSPNVFLPITRRVWNKRIRVAVAFGLITIGVKFYFWFEWEPMQRAMQMCTVLQRLFLW